MAYIDFADATLTHTGPMIVPRADRVPAKPATLSPLEWLVVAVAQGEGLRTLRTPGRSASALGSVFGVGRTMRLADERLEALRRIAVLSRHHGYAVPASEVRRFHAAGFSFDQYELVVDSAAVGRGSVRRGG